MIKRLIKYCKIAIFSSPGYFLIDIFVILLLSFVNLGRNFSLKWATEVLMVSQKTHTFDVSIFYPILLFAVLVLLGGDTVNITSMLYTMFTKNAKKIFIKNFMRKSYIEKQDMYYDKSFYDNYEFVKKNIDNTTQINETIFNNLVGASLRLIVNISAIVFFSPFVAVLLMVISVIIVIINKYVVKEQIKIGEKIINDERKANYFSWLLYSKEHAKELRLFRLKSYFQAKWQVSYKKYSNIKYKLENKSIILNSVSTFSIQLFTTVLTIYFLYLVSTGTIKVSDFVFLQGIMWSLTWSITRIVDIISGDLLKKYSYIEKYDSFIGQLNDCKPKNHLQSSNTEIKSPLMEFQNLECRNISYTYPNQQGKAVDSVNLKISKGEVICLLGYNGSGKTTLSKLICGILENYIGRITINGQEISTMNREDIYRYYGIGFQEFTRYSLSVRENIGVGMIEKSLDETEIQKAVEKGHLKKIIDKLPQGLDTLLGKEYNPDGYELSGGQWQQLIISRAYTGEPEILIFDEPTASIDPIEEMNMINQFRDLIKNKTAIFISHRIGFALIADRICYMENGKIMEEGSHDELMKLNKKYAHIYKSQQSIYKEVKVDA